MLNTKYFVYKTYFVNKFFVYELYNGNDYDKVYEV